MWLKPIPDGLRAEAVARLQAGDVCGFLGLASNTDGLDLIVKNFEMFHSSGRYEQALLWAFTITRTSHAHFPLEVLKTLFECADRTRLRAAGDPLPGSGPFTLYRGVGGVGRGRRVRGLSWSASEERARWFADRAKAFGLPDPAVFRVTVDDRDVLAYVDDREEQEFIVLLPARSRPVRVEAKTT